MSNLWKSLPWGLTKTVRAERCSNYSLGPSAEELVYETSPGQKFLTTGLNAKQFYGSPGTVSVDFVVRQDAEPTMLWPNGKVCFSNTGNLRQKSPIASELNDPIVLSSEDEEEDGIGSANKMKSKSLHPALCSPPAPSTGTVAAASKGYTSGIEQMVTSITADTESAVILPRKARMNKQFGYIIPKAPVKRRKVICQENATDVVVPVNYLNSYQSIILNCRSIRIGTLRRMVVEPVIFCLDYIKIHLEENGTRDIYLKTSELTMCEWCGVRKLPVVFLQTVRAACISLRSQLKMNREKDNVWYDCNGANLAERYIILIFETSLNPYENSIFEKIIAEIGIQNNILDFFVRIPFEEANSRLVAFSKFFEDSSKESAVRKEGKRNTYISFEYKC